MHAHMFVCNVCNYRVAMSQTPRTRGTERTKCPEDFTAQTVLQCCESIPAECVHRCKQGGNLFLYNKSLASLDRAAVHRYRVFLKDLLLRNSTGILKHSVLCTGLELFSADNDDMLTRLRVSSFLSDEAYTVIAMVHGLQDNQKSMTSGQKQHSWLLELMSVLGVKTRRDLAIALQGRGGEL